MSRIGLSNYIDCKSTNGGDGDVVSCVGYEPGHEVDSEKGIQSQSHWHYLSNQADPGGNNIGQHPQHSPRTQMHPQLSDKKLGYSIRL